VVAEDIILRTSFRSLAVELTASDTSSSGAVSSGGAQPMEVDSLDIKESDQVPDAASNAFQERILAAICDDYIFHSRTEASRTPAYWSSLALQTSPSHASY